MEKVSEIVGNDDIRFVYLVDGEMKDNTADILRRGLDMVRQSNYVLHDSVTMLFKYKTSGF